MEPVAVPRRPFIQIVLPTQNLNGGKHNDYHQLKGKTITDEPKGSQHLRQNERSLRGYARKVDRREEIAMLKKEKTTETHREKSKNLPKQKW